MSPTRDEIEAVVECARYGEEDDLGDIQAFHKAYGSTNLSRATDERRNTCLHMACANGHSDIVQFLLEHVDDECLAARNESDSTALHWAAINFHLDVLRLLCAKLSKEQLGAKNGHGKTAYDEARERCEAFEVGPEGAQDPDHPRAKERIRREVVVGYLQGFMDQDDEKQGEQEPDVAKLSLQSSSD